MKTFGIVYNNTLWFQINLLDANKDGQIWILAKDRCGQDRRPN